MSIPFFVGTYTIKMGHVPDPQGAGVTAHLLSTATGEISLIGTASTDLTGNNPTYVCKVSEVDNGEAKAFKYTIDDKGCNFELLNSLPTQGADPCHLSAQELSEGKALYLANYSGGTVSVFSIEDDNTLGKLLQNIDTEGNSGAVPHRQEKSHPHQCVLYQNKYLLVPNLGVDRIQVYPVTASGELLGEALSNAMTCSPGDGPRHMTLHPTLNVAYFIQELSSKVIVCKIDNTDGIKFEKVQEITTLPPDFSGENTTAAIRIDSTGKFLYGSNRGHDSLCVFEVDSEGLLKLVGHSATQQAPRDFAIDPTGKVIVVANQNSHSLITYSIGENGLLSKLKETYCGSPVSVLFA